jgi:hypothetical protein
MVRAVSPIPGGSVLSQPRFAVAHRSVIPAKRGGELSFDVGGRTTWFKKPKEGPFEAIAIVPFVRRGKTNYVVAWARMLPGVRSLVPTAQHDEVVLAEYREGGEQIAIGTLGVPNDLLDLASDGERVFVTAGRPTGWRIDEVMLPE